jgi:hypothetical protein
MYKDGAIYESEGIICEYLIIPLGELDGEEDGEFDEDEEDFIDEEGEDIDDSEEDGEEEEAKPAKKARHN